MVNEETNIVTILNVCPDLPLLGQIAGPHFKKFLLRITLVSECPIKLDYYYGKHWNPHC